MRVAVCLLAGVLTMVVAGAAHAESVKAQAVGQSLLQDLQQAQSLLEANRSPWQNPAGRPQAEPVALLRGELPGNGLWAAFVPVDRLVRAAYRLQRQGYIVKDAALPERREARELLPALRDAIRAERACYNPTVISIASRQVVQLDYALYNMQYHAALCLLWSTADLLGLWDRQAALIVAEEQLAAMRQRGANQAQLGERTARAMVKRTEIVARMIECALAWKPMPETVNPGIPSPLGGQVKAARHFADPTNLGGAFEPWRDQAIVGSATPVVMDTYNMRQGLMSPFRNTTCLHPCPEVYRDWQYALDDFRYGWTVYTDTAAQPWKTGSDWRRLQPWDTWPGAKGAQNAGGL